MHIYAFGSICRGDIDASSDVDILAVVDDIDQQLYPQAFSTYKYDRIKEIWQDGNAFSWHLHKESKLLYASDGVDFIDSLNSPKPYTKGQIDCEKFRTQCLRATECLSKGTSSTIFELSAIFLSIRNFAICYGLGFLDIFEFSRNSALRLGSKSLQISDASYQVLQRARLLSTRGVGEMILREELDIVMKELPTVSTWMDGLLKEVQ